MKILIALLLFCSVSFAQPVKKQPPPFDKSLSHYTQKNILDSLTNKGLTADSAKFFMSNGAHAATWENAGTITTPVSVANGGFGASTLPKNNIILGNGTVAVDSTGAGTADFILKSGGAAAKPSWISGGSFLIIVADTTGQTGKKLTVKAGGGFDWE